MVAGRRGPAPETAKREEFSRLIARGVSNQEACRLVGVNRRTGTRWLYGRTILSSNGRPLHYPPVISSRGAAEISPRYLSEEERVRIADLRRRRGSVRAIAVELGRSPSTISRELRRNADPATGSYRPFAAHRFAADRRARSRAGKLATDGALRAFVQEKLLARWSPEQICQALRGQFPAEPARHLVHETVYQAVYRLGPDVLTRNLPFRVLRSRRLRRRPRRRADARRARGELRDMVMIEHRPVEVIDRAMPGHWEGDLITGAANRSAIGTLVERTTRFTILLHLPDGNHAARPVRDALIEAMVYLPPQLRRSLTWDQGKEMALHLDITTALGMPVFFCHKASPWQRPTNENTNGLLRHYFPRGTDLRAHSPQRLAQVAAELNDRPRKTLGWNTPAALLAQNLASTGSRYDHAPS